MLAFMIDPRKRGIVFAIVLAALVVGLLAPMVIGTDGRHLTAYRTGDEDLSQMRSAIEAKASRVDAYLSTPHQLADVAAPEKTLFMAIGTERRYTDSEADAILAFLERGGNVILADEGGYGNDIAAKAGFAFLGQSLLDSAGHRGDPNFPVVENVEIDGVKNLKIVFNAPTALQPLSNAGSYEVLVRSSAAVYPDGSYLDKNEDGKIDIDDTPGPHALVVRTSVGQGTLVLVADTGLFMNAQLTDPGYDNDNFVPALVDSLVDNDGVIILDEGRHAQAALLAPYANAIRWTGLLTSGPLAPFVTLALLAAGTLLAWRLTRETDDWSHHAHDIGRDVPTPAEVRPDLERAQRMARRAVSERFNIPLEQVAAMPAEQLVSLVGDRTLAEAAAGTLKSDPAPLFKSFSPTPEAN